MEIPSVIEELLKKNKIKYFWDSFDFLKNLSYTEYEAILMSNVYCNSNIWGGIIGCEVTSTSFLNGTINGYAITTTNTTIVTNNLIFNQSKSENYIDSFDIFLLMNVDPIQIPLYRSYLKIRKYEVYVDLDENIKKITLNFDSQFASQLFNDGCKEYLLE